MNTTTYTITLEESLYLSIAVRNGWIMNKTVEGVELNSEDKTPLQFVQELIQKRVLASWLANETFEVSQEQLVQARNDLYNDSIAQAEGMVSIK